MTDEENTDELAASSRRLGDRFAGKSSSSSSPDQEDPDSEQESQATQESSSSDTDTQTATEYVPATLYLPEESRREMRRFLKRLTLDYPDIEEAEKRELHTALIHASMEYPEEIADLTKERMQ